MKTAERALLEAQNPFADPVARLDADVPPPPDVEAIHASVRHELRAAIEAVGRGRNAAMVLVKGDPGQGKTHQLTWLRHTARGAYYFVEIPPLKDAGAPFAHILRYTIQGLSAHGVLGRLLWESLRRVAAAVRDAALADGDDETAARVEQALLGDARFVETFRALVQCDDGAEPPLADLLFRRGRGRPPLSELAPDFSRVLCRLPDRNAEAALIDWLRGAELPDEDLFLLGVKSSLDSEAKCFEALRSLVRLCPRPIALCFDQLESTSGLLGIGGAVSLFNALMEIYQQLPVCVLLMCQTQHWADLRQHVPHAGRERIRELLPMPLPTAEEATRLVEARLADLWRAAGVSPPYPTYPFPPAYLAAYTAKSRPTIRRILLDCGDLLDDMRRRGAVVEPALAAQPAAAAVPVVKLSDTLGREHARALRSAGERADLATPLLRQERLRSAVVQVLSALAARKLPVVGVRVVEVEAPPRPRAGARTPLRLLLAEDRPGARAWRYAVELYSDDARGAWRVLERLKDRVDEEAADAALLLREAETPVGDGARRTLELIRSLEPMGGLLYLDKESCGRLLGAELLLDAVSAGEVWHGDRAATRDEAMGFLLEHDRLGEVLVPLFGRIAGGVEDIVQALEAMEGSPA